MLGGERQERPRSRRQSGAFNAIHTLYSDSQTTPRHWDRILPWSCRDAQMTQDHPNSTWKAG